MIGPIFCHCTRRNFLSQAATPEATVKPVGDDTTVSHEHLATLRRGNRNCARLVVWDGPGKSAGGICSEQQPNLQYSQRGLF